MDSYSKDEFWLSFLESRRSVRRFREEPVLRPALEQVIHTATYAPSAHNRQPWRFVILETNLSRTSLTGAMGAGFLRDLLYDGLSHEEAQIQVDRSRERILQAPAAILLCVDTADLDQYPDPLRQQAGYLMGVQSVALAGGNLLLAAHAIGLGGVWVCAPLFAREPVRRALDLPVDWDPQGLLLLGYPAKVPEPRPRRPLDEVICYL